MKNIKFPILTIVAVAIFYLIVLPLYHNSPIVMGLFMASPFLVIWMAYIIVKDEEKMVKAFDSSAYQNSDIKSFHVKKGWNRA